METQMENKTLRKLSKAIEIIKSKNLKKLGRNTFSNYDYYTPAQVAELVTGATHEVGLLAKFDLIRNDLGISGRLSIYDLDINSEPVIFELASAIPEIKATNIIQQLGGAMTYTKRYLLMNAFDIVDNNLDFDTTDNMQKHEKAVAKTEIDDAIKESVKNINTIENIVKFWNANKGLHTNQQFIELLGNRKKILIQNGIE